MNCALAIALGLPKFGVEQRNVNARPDASEQVLRIEKSDVRVLRSAKRKECELGKKLAREAPTSSLAAAVCRSACAISGRRRNSSAGAARGGFGKGSRFEDRATENEAAALPTSAAMEFSRVARLSKRSDSCASASEQGLGPVDVDRRGDVCREPILSELERRPGASCRAAEQRRQDLRPVAQCCAAGGGGCPARCRS